jgi:HK97 gp10 family phage protein
MANLIVGMDKLEAKLKKMEKAAPIVLLGVLQSCAETVRTNAIKSIQAKKGSVLATRYRKGGNKRLVTVSPEGSAPNTDTGNLVRNIQVERKDGSVVVGSFERASYGKHLEFGTYKMGARPWLMPALKESMPIINQKLAKVGLTLRTDSDV